MRRMEKVRKHGKRNDIGQKLMSETTTK